PTWLRWPSQSQIQHHRTSATTNFCRPSEAEVIGRVVGSSYRFNQLPPFARGRFIAVTKFGDLKSASQARTVARGSFGENLTCGPDPLSHTAPSRTDHLPMSPELAALMSS